MELLKKNFEYFPMALLLALGVATTQSARANIQLPIGTRFVAKSNLTVQFAAPYAQTVVFSPAQKSGGTLNEYAPPQIYVGKSIWDVADLNPKLGACGVDLNLTPQMLTQMEIHIGDVYRVTDFDGKFDSGGNTNGVGYMKFALANSAGEKLIFVCFSPTEPTPNGNANWTTSNFKDVFETIFNIGI